MLLLFPQWQLWNQIFQYQFAKSIVKKWEKIITSHSPYFSIIDESGNQCFRFIPWKKIRKYANFWCMKICNIFAKLRIISHIKAKWEYYQQYWIEKKWYVIKKWLFRNIKFIDGFFINDDIHLQQNFKIKQSYIDNAESFLSQIPSNLNKIFIHARRWDYLTWGVLWDTDMTLPLSYYNSVISFFQKKYKDIVFIFLSDDIQRCKKEFSKVKNSYFSENNSVWTDLAIMTLCDGAGISASTLSFLWAYYCKRTLEIIWPKYFNWFKKQIRNPLGIDSKDFIWIDVSEIK